jgi:predicted metal-dependent hydrolase
MAHREPDRTFWADKSGTPAYRIRTSPRARHVRLQVSARDGLTVVVPRGFDLTRLPAIMEGKRGWVETHLQCFADAVERKALETAALSEILDLEALGESWRVEYRVAKTCRVGVIAEQPGRLVVYGAVGDAEACRAALRLWLQWQAREELVPRLTELAELHGFRFSEVLIRGQKTRWASCSAKGVISLSYKLLFLDRDAVRYVLLHELCHTVEMNHSPRFWGLLSRFEPECKAIRKRMRNAEKHVPAWVEA